MAQHGTTRRTAPGSRGETSAIPDKLYFRIGEVAALCEVATYVLRFWESEFPQLKPNKGGTGQRLYRRRDVEMALRIKTLLYDEGFTIPGARQTLKTEQRHKEPQLSLAILESESTPSVSRKGLLRLQKDMKELLSMLSVPASKGALQSIRAPRTQRPELSDLSSSDDLFS
ncbi:MerR family transcriptional regulator [Granulicella arctica]|uniref:MerR family transcriptional regulator n=1 Tax=Granulicella arctica TaxID=940613 RepID=UPI0021E08877|nr:MerR family transcriptional regulator [Granulicella arctica]